MAVVLDDIRRLLAFFGDTEIRFDMLSFRGEVVAFYNPSKAVVLAPVYQGGEMVQKARNVARGETAEHVATMIVNRFLRRAA